MSVFIPITEQDFIDLTQENVKGIIDAVKGDKYLVRSISNEGYELLYWYLGSPIKSSILQVGLVDVIDAEVKISILSCGEKDIST